MELLLKHISRAFQVCPRRLVLNYSFSEAQVLTFTLQNAFVEQLGVSFNPSNMLVVDLMHEFELGVWKTLFTHLIRLLYAAGNGTDRLVLELDRRYVQPSTSNLGCTNL